MLGSQTDKSWRTALVVGCRPQIETNDGTAQDSLPVRGACRQPSLGKPAIEPKDCFYEDSFVKPNLMSILMSAQLGVASWAPDEDAADAS